MDLHVVVASGKQVHHTVLSAGEWQPIGDVNREVGSVDGTIFPADQVESANPLELRPGSVSGVVAVATTSIAARLHVFALCDFLAGTVRFSDGRWTPFAGVAAPDTFKGFHLLAAASVAEEIHVCVGSSSTILHGRRRANGTWSEFTPVPIALPPSIGSIACACAGAQLHLVIVGSGQVSHTILGRDGSWQPAGDVLGQVGPIAGAQVVTACGLLGAVHLIVGGTALVHVTRRVDGNWTRGSEEVNRRAGDPGALEHLAVVHRDDTLHLLVDSADGLLHTEESKGPGKAPRLWTRFADLWSLAMGPVPMPDVTALSATNLTQPPAFELEINGMSPYVDALIASKISDSLKKVATGPLSMLLKKPAASFYTFPLFGETWTRIGVFLHREPHRSQPFILDESPCALVREQMSMRIPIETFEDLIGVYWTSKAGSADGVLTETTKLPDGNTLLEMKIHRPTVTTISSPPTVRLDAIVDCSQPGGVTFRAIGHHSLVFRVENASVGLGTAAELLSVVRTTESDSFEVSDQVREALSGIDFLALGAFHPAVQFIVESAAAIILATVSIDFEISVGGQVDSVFYPKVYVSGGSKVTFSYETVAASGLGIIATVERLQKKRTPALVVYRPVEFTRGVFQVTCEVDDMMSPTFAWSSSSKYLVLQGKPTTRSTGGGLRRTSTATFTVMAHQGFASLVATVTATDGDPPQGGAVLTGSVAIPDPNVPAPAPKVRPGPRPLEKALKGGKALKGAKTLKSPKALKPVKATKSRR